MRRRGKQEEIPDESFNDDASFDETTVHHETNYTPERHTFLGRTCATLTLLAVGYAGGVVTENMPPVHRVKNDVLGVLGFMTDENLGPYANPTNSPSTSSQPMQTAPANPTTSGSPKPAPAKKHQTAAECVAALPFEVKVGQRLMPGIYNKDISQRAKDYNEAHIGGMLIMESPPHPQAGSIKTFAAQQEIAPDISVDQEGGTVQRFKMEGRLPAATDVKNTMSTDDAYNLYLKDDEYLRTAGITTNFAPDADVHSADPNINPLPTRMYSRHPDKVTAYAGAAVRAAKAAGIHPVLKHWPGLGSVRGNTDDAPQKTRPFAQLLQRDLKPYVGLSDSGANVMVSVAVVPGLTNGKPAALSPEAIQVLRNSYGTEKTVLYSDSLTAAAIGRDLPDAIVAAMEAGIDSAVYVQDSSDGPRHTYKDVLKLARQHNKSGELTDKAMNQSVLRILENKGVDPCKIDINN